MKAKRNSGKVVLAILGAAVVIPLAATVPAEADLNKRGFLVQAASIPDPEIQSIAGSLLSTSDGGTVSPPTSSVVFSYSCGSAKLDITSEDIEFSKANEELLRSGSSVDSMPSAPDGGWKLISHSYEDTQIAAGAPSRSEEQPNYIALGGWPQPRILPTAYFALNSPQLGGGCAISDKRIPAVAGNIFSYGQMGTASHSEGRYVNESGRVVAVTVEKSSSGKTTVSRESESNEYPEREVWGTDGSHEIRMIFPDKRDGYNSVSIAKAANGSKTYTFTNRKIGTTATTNAFEKVGPTKVSIDGSDNVISFSYSTGSSITDVNRSANPIRLADFRSTYNQLTGKNWDGVLPLESDFPRANKSVPFEPTAPRL